MPNTPRPEATCTRKSPSASTGLKPSGLDIVIQEGTIVSPDDPRINGAVVVRSGSFSVEMDVETPQGGLQTLMVEHVEAGEYFFEHLLFGIKEENSLGLRYRARKRSTIIVVTSDMIRSPDKIYTVCGMILRLKNRELDRHRRRMLGRQSRETELLAAIATLKSVSEKAAREADALRHENSSLQDQILELSQEQERTSSVLNENAEENRQLWDQVRMHEGRAVRQDKEIAMLKTKIATLEYEDAGRAFQELTNEILRAQEATQSIKQREIELDKRLNLMQRGIELLSKENPELWLSSDAMQMLLGEEPQPKPKPKPLPADEFDRIFDENPQPIPPKSPAVQQRRPQGLSARITNPPPPSIRRAPRPKAPAQSASPKALPIACPPALNRRDTSGPEIHFAQEEASSEVAQLVKVLEPRRLATLVDPLEAMPDGDMEETGLKPTICLPINGLPSAATSQVPDKEAEHVPDSGVTRTWDQILDHPAHDNSDEFFDMDDDEDEYGPRVTQPYQLPDTPMDTKKRRP